MKLKTLSHHARDLGKKVSTPYTNQIFYQKLITVVY